MHILYSRGSLVRLYCRLFTVSLILEVTVSSACHMYATKANFLSQPHEAFKTLNPKAVSITDSEVTTFGAIEW